jgi:hypothetical protein
MLTCFFPSHRLLLVYRPAIVMSSGPLQPDKLDVFNPEMLSTDELIDLGLVVVENLNPACYDSVIAECVERPFALEFILSGLCSVYVMKRCV